MAIELDILDDDPAWETSDLEPLIRRSAEETGKETEVSGEAALLLTNNARMQELNRDWRGKDRPTDVLAFEADEHAAPFLGDIAIGFETAQADASAMGKPFEAHVTHLVVHGLLHLMGHTHEEDAAAEEMEALECRILEKMGLPDPYSPEFGRESPSEQKSSDAT